MAKKLALLVGCNYTNNPDVPENNKLHGCINDVKFMQALISQPCYGFQDITILTDETATFLNIINALNRLIGKAEQGDNLLFYFSGGGALAKPNGIPVIVPCEPKPISPITGEDILSVLKPLPDGAFFTFICDSSYSGGLFAGNAQTVTNVPNPGPKFHWKTIPSDLLKPTKDIPPPPPKQIILFCSSNANEESAEVYPNGDKSKAVSAFSNAIQALLNSPELVNMPVNPPRARNDPKARNTNREVAAFTKGLLGFLGFDQRPYLNCSDILAAALFLHGYVA